MVINRLQLINFKNLNLVVDFDKGINLVIGDNGKGKTNLLESIFYLSRLDSFRVDDIKEIFPWDKKQSLKIGAVIENDEEHILEIVIREESGLIKRNYELNGKKISKLKLLHFFPVFLFLPKDLDLVNGSPKIRRNELDAFMEMIDKDFASIRIRYNRILASRNKLIKQILERNAPASQLDFWDDKLVELGSQIIERRLCVLDEFKDYISRTSEELFSGELSNLQINYISKLVADEIRDLENDNRYRKICKTFSYKISTGRMKEMGAGRTLYGPQRDDLEFCIGRMNVHKAGSRGQQRLVTLLIKFAMFKFYEEKTGKKACLLLDDVMSELDDKNKHKLENIVRNLDTQVIFTSTTEADFSKSTLKSSKRISI